MPLLKNVLRRSTTSCLTELPSLPSPPARGQGRGSCGPGDSRGPLSAAACHGSRPARQSSACVWKFSAMRGWLLCEGLTVCVPGAAPRQGLVPLTCSCSRVPSALPLAPLPGGALRGQDSVSCKPASPMVLCKLQTLTQRQANWKSKEFICADFFLPFQLFRVRQGSEEVGKRPHKKQ